MGLLHTALTELGDEDHDAAERGDRLDPPVPLDAALPVSRLAEDAVRFADLAARRLGVPPAPLDGARIATSFTSDRHFRWNGAAPDAWAPLSGFWATADGWLRTHANYAHHRRALLGVLGIPDADDALAKASVAEALRTVTALDAEDAIVEAGGVAAAVRTTEQWRMHPHGAGVGAAPLLGVRERGSARAEEDPTIRRPGVRPGPRPLIGLRVLDLTRVLAGPICTRTLALWGADVLRVDPPHLAEPEWIHLDTGAGKRSALLDLRTERAAFEDLLARADVLVHGYRPGALQTIGLDDAVARHPGLIVASLSAWGPGPWRQRRGFDSIVQAASGIALAESPDGVRPGALPAQALDHSAGYLLAGAVARLLRRRDETGGSWSVETSLARIAHELLRLPREPRRPEITCTPTVATMRTAAGTLTLARPALGAEDSALPPRRFGADAPSWEAPLS